MTPPKKRHPAISAAQARWTAEDRLYRASGNTEAEAEARADFVLDVLETLPKRKRTEKRRAALTQFAETIQPVIQRNTRLPWRLEIDARHQRRKATSSTAPIPSENPSND